MRPDARLRISDVVAAGVLIGERFIAATNKSRTSASGVGFPLTTSENSRILPTRSAATH
ncbi:MAG: hypothetical protein ABI634_01155 [Acidobacteriota bacterium]